MCLQVDCKFIFVACGSSLCVVDQHAADERVRLESMTQAVLSARGRGRGPQGAVAEGERLFWPDPAALASVSVRNPLVTNLLSLLSHSSRDLKLHIRLSLASN